MRRLLRASRVAVLRIVVTSFVLSAISFGLLHAMPGSADEQILAQNPSLSAAEIDRVRTLRGLDRSIPARYGCWLVGRHDSICRWWPGGDGLLFGDLGWSSIHGEPVRPLLWRRFKTSLSLMFPALLLSLVLSIGIGVRAAARPDGAFDRFTKVVTFTGLSMPAHWTSLLAVFVFAVLLGWFPASGINDVGDASIAGAIRHAVLPTAVLVVVFVSRWTRFVRAATEEALRSPYVVAARAKGLSTDRVLYVHALSNALFPLITIVTQSLPFLFSGALIVERVFAYPGVGLLIFESVSKHDHLVAMVVFLVYAALTMIAMALADVLYVVADPRLREEHS